MICVSPRVSKGSLTRGALPDGRASDLIGQKRALARNFRNPVEDFIHRLKAQVCHANRVNIRIAERDAQLRAALQHPALFAGEFLAIAFDDLLQGIGTPFPSPAGEGVRGEGVNARDGIDEKMCSSFTKPSPNPLPQGEGNNTN